MIFFFDEMQKNLTIATGIIICGGLLEIYGTAICSEIAAVNEPRRTRFIIDAERLANNLRENNEIIEQRYHLAEIQNPEVAAFFGGGVYIFPKLEIISEQGYLEYLFGVQREQTKKLNSYIDCGIYLYGEMK
ncbi:MAG: hypothetical protein LBT03_02380 [Holosporales bacterium]|jgi:hypothetical protein|nr:hypothetical protein [Holosporales bacterium]